MCEGDINKVFQSSKEYLRAVYEAERDARTASKDAQKRAEIAKMTPVRTEGPLFFDTHTYKVWKLNHAG